MSTPTSKGVKEKNPNKPICPKCFDYSLIHLSSDKPKEITINCDNCGLEQEMNIKEYINQISELNKNNKISQVVKCEKHYKTFSFFCTQCNSHLCSQCKESSIMHKNHKLIELNKTKLDITTIKDKIVEAHDFIDIYFNELKEKQIKYLQKMINKIEYSYEECSSKNKDLLSLVEVMVEAYIPDCPNYYINTNIMNNCNINLSKLKEEKEENINEVIEYFKNFYIIKQSIKLSSIKEVQSIKEHTNKVTSVILLQDGRLASCSTDKTIRIININTSQCEIIIRGHQKAVTYISQLDNGKLISCSCDKSIKVWSIAQNTFELEETIEEAHNDLILKIIALSQNRMGTCSADNTIKIWNSNKPYNLSSKLEGHTDWVNSIIQLKGKEILVSGSGGDDGSLRIWCLKTYKCNKVLKNILCCYYNSMIEMSNNRVAIGGENKIFIINTITFQTEQYIKSEGIGFVNSIIELRDGNLLGGFEKGNIGLYDLNLNEIYLKETTHSKDISGLIKINKTLFASCSYDKTVRVWSY